MIQFEPSTNLVVEKNQVTVPNNAQQKAEGFMQRMAVVMADENVKSFFRDYFSTWSDARAALMLLQTYIVIDEAYLQKTGTRMSSEQISAVVREMVSDKECRKILVDAMSQFSSGTEQKFLSAYRKIAPLSE